MHNNFILPAILCATLLGGCATSSIKITHTVPVPITHARYAPTSAELKAQMNGHGQKVLITPVTYEKEYEARYAIQTYDDLSQRMLMAGYDVVNLALSKKFNDDFSHSGKLSTDHQKLAELVIVPKISDLTYSRDFTEAKSWTDSKGKTHRSDPYCTFRSYATVNVQTYELPDMTPVSSYEYKGSDQDRLETGSSRCPISDNMLSGLFTKAYVIERRDNTDNYAESIFRVTVGSRQGAIPGKKVKFFRTEAWTSSLTNEKNTRQVFVGYGTVIAPVDRRGAYVMVDEYDVIEAIRIGDVAKLDFTKCAIGEGEFLGSCSTFGGLFSD